MKNPRKKASSLHKYLLADSLEAALSLTRQHSLTTRYSLAVLSSSLTMVLKLGLDQIIGKEAPFLLVLPSVLISTWFGGKGAGILAAILSGLGIYYFFLPPYNVFWPVELSSIAVVLIYMVEASLIIFIINRRNKAYKEVKIRTAQQAMLAALGQYGLEEPDMHSLMSRTVRAFVKTFDVEHGSIFELLPDEKRLRLISGVGWKKGIVKKLILDDGKNSLPGFTLLSNKSVVVSHLEKEKRFSNSLLLKEAGIKSSLAVVISGYPRPYGVLTVHSKKLRNFSKEDLDFVRALANVLAITLERKMTQETLEIVASLNTEITSSLNPQKTLSELVKMLVPNFADFCEVYVKKDSVHNELIEVAAREKNKAKILTQITKNYPPVGKSKRPAKRVITTGKALFLSTIPTNWEESVAETEEHLSLLQQLKIQSLMVVPLKLRSQVIGAITFGATSQGRIYSRRDLVLAQEIASRAAIAIDNGRLYREAREAIQARDEFLSIASHELKTPLTSLLLQLQSVLHNIKNESLANFSIERTMSSLESMIGQSKRITRLVNDLLNISLITTGKMQLEKDSTDITQVVRDVVSKLKEESKQKGSKIEIVDGRAILGKWDKVRIEQVVTNLVTNAIKYGEGKPIKVSVANSNNLATLVVEDQGIGIPSDQQKAIFDRFERVSSVKGAYKGLGVGLYLVAQIVKAHGGKISVSSNPQKGSTFTVELPLK